MLCHASTTPSFDSPLSFFRTSQPSPSFNTTSLLDKYTPSSSGYLYN